MVLDRATIERVQIVIEDLLFLRDSWDQEVDDGSLRRSTPIFRRLLVDNDLSRAWHDLGFDKQPILRAPSLEAQLRGIPLGEVAYAQAGGATHKGLSVAVPVEIKCYISPEKAAELFGPANDRPERELSLRRFLQATCVIVDGVQINRHLLIVYVANKLGGTHFDPRRNMNREDERKFELLDRVRAEYTTADKPAVYFELLSLGQALLRSFDIQRLMEMGANALPTPN